MLFSSFFVFRESIVNARDAAMYAKITELLTFSENARYSCEITGTIGVLIVFVLDGIVSVYLTSYHRFV